jgi:hypothetical protein
MMNGSNPPEELDSIVTGVSTSHDNATAWYEDAATEIAELPSILSPASPPPFAKDRVMARVRKDSVNYYIPDTSDPSVLS